MVRYIALQFTYLPSALVMPSTYQHIQHISLCTGSYFCHIKTAILITSLLILITHQLCDQMARLFLNIGPFKTMEICPKA